MVREWPFKPNFSGEKLEGNSALGTKRGRSSEKGPSFHGRKEVALSFHLNESQLNVSLIELRT